MTEDMDRPNLGIGLRLLSGLLFTAMVVCVKATSDAVPLGEIVFFRSAFALIPLVIFLWWRREFPGGLRTRRPWGHVLRSSLGAAGLFASFASVARLPVAEASLIGHLGPVFMLIGAALVLSERLTPARVIGMVLGLLGVLVLVWPDIGGGRTDAARLAGYGFGLITAIFAAAALIMVRSLNRTESPGAIAFWFVIVSMAGGLATLPWGWILPDGPTLALLIFAGIAGGMAHIAMTLAFRFAEASRQAAFEYVAIGWPVLADLFLFDTPISTSFLLALPLVLGGAVIAAAEGRRAAAPSATARGT